MFYLPVRPLALLLSATMSVAALHGEAMAQATGISPQGVPTSPFLGRWELDLTRMPDSYGPPPKRVVYDFQVLASGKWRTTIDITAPNDSVRHMMVEYRPDGTFAPGGGDTSEADSAAIMVPTPNVLVMNLAKNKRLGSVRVYTVSADGKEMIESAAAINPLGKPFVRNFRYKRLP
ncbi:hypothetical protein [Sphingomonas zeae]|jgi:hypothetical protein